jgi:hypothetical protein
MREDIVVYGSTGKITFSVFENVPLLLTNEGETKLIIEHRKHSITPCTKDAQSLTSNSKHPSDGNTATHTSWIMDKIVGIYYKRNSYTDEADFLGNPFLQFLQ